MRSIVIAVIFMLITMTGCIVTKSHSGNYLQTLMIGSQRKLAAETVRQMVTIWSPAKVQLEIQHQASDVFGVELIKGLRENGYAVLEYNQDSVLRWGATRKSSQLIMTDAADSIPLPLSYVLDQALGLNFYRLTLTVGMQSIARPYFIQNEELVPAGYWTYNLQ